MIKKPCYFTVVDKNEKRVITAVCIDCKKQKNLTGWYWDKDFNEEDEEIKCNFCENIIFKRDK